MTIASNTVQPYVFKHRSWNGIENVGRIPRILEFVHSAVNPRISVISACAALLVIGSLGATSAAAASQAAMSEQLPLLKVQQLRRDQLDTALALLRDREQRLA